MAEYAVSSVICCLDELISHFPDLKIRLLPIQAKLRQIQSVLEIADTRQEIDEGIRSWIYEAREVAYDIEDLLIVAISSKKDGNLWRKYSHGRTSQSIDHKIQGIDSKISALQSDLRVRHIKPRQKGPEDCSNPTRTASLHPYHVDEDFVGLEDDLNGLVRKLVGPDDGSYQVVSVTGAVGIGKTSLAKKVYERVEALGCFDALAWVVVSQEWQQLDVLRKILNGLEPTKRRSVQEMNLDGLAEELRNVQTRKRCLIVLDDVCESEVWDTLRPAFPSSTATNSKVLITTRDREIATYVDLDNPCYVYEQRPLNEVESWELLKKRVSRGLRTAGLSFESRQGSGIRVGEDNSAVFDDDDTSSTTGSFRSCLSDEEDEQMTNQLRASSSSGSIRDQRDQADMEKLGKDMLSLCAGLPLTIIVLGGLLMTKPKVSEWRTVHQNLNSYLRRARNFRESGKVFDVLALSYHDLPYQLKPCFLHLGNFPEDTKIPALKLYKLWAAEGFITSARTAPSSPSSSGQQPIQKADEEDESIMDIGERYLGELAQRFLVKVQVDDVTGRFKTCRLNDVARELCVIKGKEECFLKKIPPRYEPELIGTPSPSPRAVSSNIARRLSIAVDHDFDTYFPPINEKLDRIRSAMFFSRLGDRRNLQPTLDILCEESKLLRVLDLERFDFGDQLSKNVGDLIHLKYLSLRKSKLNKLPSSIGNLRYLQTLDLRVPFLVATKIPDVIHKLSNLKHLYLPPSHRCAGRLQLDTLSELEILKNFDTRVSDYRDIRKLTKLQKLSAISSLETEHLANLINWLRLEHINIRESSLRIRHDFQSDRELIVLKHLVGLIHVRKLDLVGMIRKVPEHSLFSGSLNKLTLRSSKLREDPMANLEKLPNLYSLMLRKNAYEGEEIRCSRQGFPRLRNLELQGLSNLKQWTIEEGALASLSRLKIDECDKLMEIPQGIQYALSVKELVIANMSEGFKRRVRMVDGEGGEDVCKIEHVQSVIFSEVDTNTLRRLESQSSGRSNTGILHTFAPTLVPREWQS